MELTFWKLCTGRSLSSSEWAWYGAGDESSGMVAFSDRSGS